MDRKLGGDVVFACCVLAQVQLQLPLHELLILPFHDHFSVILVVHQLLIQHPYEGVLICGDVFSNLLLSIAQLLNNGLHDLLIKAVIKS